MSETERHCLELVRAADKDRFLAGLFIPEEKRRYIMALYAFNVELARIRESVSEITLGEIRLQWWRDTIEAIFSKENQQHPVAQELALAIRKGAIPKAPLLNMIEARQFDLYNDPMPTMRDLEGYLGETSSMLIQLAATILTGPDAAAQIAETAGFSGVAWGLTGLLRSLPLHRARGQCYMPKDLLARHGLTPADLIAGREPEKLLAMLSEALARAQLRLSEARASASELTTAARPAFLVLSLTEPYLKKIARLGLRALTTVAEVSQLRRQATLFLAARRERF